MIGGLEPSTLQSMSLGVAQDLPVLVTGAQGNIGKMLQGKLRRPIRPFDILGEQPGELCSVTDLDSVMSAMSGVEAVVHLAAVADEAPFSTVMDVNIRGTQIVLEAAQRLGVRTVVLASSNHAVGFAQRTEDALPADIPPRPDTFYGFSKAAGEMLGSLYHDRFGINVVCVRVGTCYQQPFDVRGLSTWLSPSDAVRLFDAAIDAKGFHTVWGISANSRRWWSLDAGKRIGYYPQDDAEQFASEILAERATDLSPDLGQSHVGGFFCELPLGVGRTF